MRSWMFFGALLGALSQNLALANDAAKSEVKAGEVELRTCVPAPVVEGRKDWDEEVDNGRFRPMVCLKQTPPEARKPAATRPNLVDQGKTREAKPTLEAELKNTPAHGTTVNDVCPTYRLMIQKLGNGSSRIVCFSE